MRWVSRLRAQLARLAQDRDGAAAVVTAVGLVAALGFTALGADLGVAYAHRRAAQSAADSAAFSGGVAKMGATTNVADQARAVTRSYGLVHGVGGVNVIVNSPALTGAMAGVPQSVEVIVERPMARFFAGLLGVNSATLRARAVAVAGRRGDGCVIAFNPTAIWAVNFNGNPDVNLAGCSLFANSNNSQAMMMNGSPSLSAQSVRLVGGYALNGNPDLTTVDGVKTGQQAIPDPYADVPVPRAEHCSYTNHLVSGGATFSTSAGSPTTFCQGLTINGNGVVNFEPGIYIIDRGAFIANGTATINAPGVTFVLTSSTGSNHATATINGNINMNASAPTGGPTAGMLFFQDRAAASTGTNTLNGNSGLSLRGALYFPRQQVTFNGNNNTATGGCTQLLADKVIFNGNPGFAINCQGAGTRAIGGMPTELVE